MMTDTVWCPKCKRLKAVLMREPMDVPQPRDRIDRTGRTAVPYVGVLECLHTMRWIGVK